MPRRPGFFTFPHYKATPRAVQPDYGLWNTVTIGTTRAEVIELLGRPLRDPYLAPRPKKMDPLYVYGYIELEMMPHVRTYRFTVGFDDGGRVCTKEDPFGGIFSADGKPSKPQIFCPPDGASFQHYPRVLDMRWHPVSGVYPIWYEIEVGWRAPFDSAATFVDESRDFQLPFPYHVIEFGGSQPGRFRVRGINMLGMGEWSEHRNFDFTPRPPVHT